MEAKALRVTLKLREFFPPGDPLSVPLLTLMAATNDARQLQRLLIVARPAAEGASEANRSILNGEIGYLFRVLAGHLYEAGLMFRKLDELAGADADRLLAEPLKQPPRSPGSAKCFWTRAPGGSSKAPSIGSGTMGCFTTTRPR